MINNNPPPTYPDRLVLGDSGHGNTNARLGRTNKSTSLSLSTLSLSDDFLPDVLHMIYSDVKCTRKIKATHKKSKLQRTKTLAAASSSSADDGTANTSTVRSEYIKQ